MEYSPPKPGSSVRWPMRVATVPEIIRVVREGFELWVVHGKNDQPIYRIFLNGVQSPYLDLNQSAARKAHNKYFENGPRLPNWNFPLVLKEKGSPNTTSRQVMNPPGDEPEAGNLANTAPRQSDPDDARRGETGMSSGSEARPVTATAHTNTKGRTR